MPSIMQTLLMFNVQFMVINILIYFYLFNFSKAFYLHISLAGNELYID